mmetsp:Transcript_4798/g.15735  ORF Transcript_4798/g.15735 Transcript_4798/m.15735 type:complete len:355 (-) Transcript_4798:56-1120(-)
MKLLDFYASKGVFLSPKVEVAAIHGVGLRAAKAMGPGELVVSVPWSKCLWASDWVDDNNHNDQLFGKQADRLALRLASAWLDGSDLPLPTCRRRDLPVHWGPDRLSETTATPTLARKARQRRRRADELTKNRRQQKEAFAVDHALDAVSSRAFSVPRRVSPTNLLPWLLRSAFFKSSAGGGGGAGGGKGGERDLAIVPGADLLNCGGATPGGATTRLFSVPLLERVEVRTSRRVDVGKELTLSYGARPNEDFFLNFGFVFKDNPYDTRRIENTTVTVRRGGVLDNDDDKDNKKDTARTKQEETSLQDRLQADLARLREAADRLDAPELARAYCREQVRLLEEIDQDQTLTDPPS